MSSLKYLLWLTTRRGLRIEQAHRLTDQFGSAEAAYYADPAQYDLLPVGDWVKQSLCDKSFTSAEQVLARCDELGIRLVTYLDAAYPERLRRLENLPLILYIKGRRILFDDELVISMVGSRACTPYGAGMAGKLALELARNKVIVVSGIAEGIDTASLKGALMGGGTVVSVLAGGIDVFYPKQNEWLYRDVAAAGALISEYPPGASYDKSHFPARNRIISGLARGVLAVEAEERSGTMITVSRALDQEKDLFAVPGPADAPMSTGTNGLIASGQAKMVRSAADILEEYALGIERRVGQIAPLTEREQAARLSAAAALEEQAPEPERAPEPELPGLKAEAWDALADLERAVLSLLAESPYSADDLVGKTEASARQIYTTMTILQTQGYVRELPGRRFASAVRIENK